MSDLSGRSSRRALDCILAQIAAAEQGARLAHELTRGQVDTKDARGSMSEIEHQGDDHRAQLVRALSHSLTTLIDREDLYRLSRSVDDVLDNLRDFVRESDLYQVDSPAVTEPLLAAVVEGLRGLGRAVESLTTDPTAVEERVLAARKEANSVRNLYQVQLGELFTGQPRMDTFKTRELLRRIDVVALRMNEACDALSDGLLKRHF